MGSLIAPMEFLRPTGLDLGIVDSSFPKDQVSTKAGQLQMLA